MQLTRSNLPMLSLLQGFGLNRYVRGWNRVLSQIFPQSAQDSRHLETARWGVTYLANPANYIDWHVLLFGDYERDDLELFRLLGKRDAVCLDIGANVGHHSVFFASLGWTVHAFEPNPQLWTEFDAKREASNLQTITLHKLGLGAEDKNLAFELENAVNSGTGRFVDGEETAAGCVRVGHLPVRNGDRYLRQAGITRVDVIKVDVQGFEPKALTGLRETLHRCRPIISVEIDRLSAEKFGSLDGLRSYLPDNYAFLCSRIRKAGPVRWTITEPYSGERFATRNGNIFCVPRS